MSENENDEQPLDIPIHNEPFDPADQPGDDERMERVFGTVMHEADERLDELRERADGLGERLAVLEEVGDGVVVSKPSLELDAAQAVVAQTWHEHLGGNGLTPVAEHEMLEAIGTDPTLRDSIVVETLYPWLSLEIDGVPQVSTTPAEAAERLEDLLGRCRDHTPEKSTCEALLFTARLGEQMARSDNDFMKALAWMSDEDVKMLVEASSYATPETAEYIKVIVQSIAVTKVAR